nr:hypothetical protein CFP56_68855 [Quercus suber]
MESCDASLGVGKDGLSSAFVYVCETFGKGWLEVEVRGALASSEFESPGSKPMQLVDELGCAHSSLSHRRSGQGRDHYISILEVLFAELSREE